ncbi:SNF2 helicase, putative [Bodo saltans]|uniref:SNF2 helicase, putative n=1 Tax=Bodo saltans TaxID=75058 RepID=A0A0S4JD76_BODSA|nr:SNF2 helicase, putative [Bodo saltans]|eukprot:CUG89514.1 SNF2 helicase, putative [Bodo saltans]
MASSSGSVLPLTSSTPSSLRITSPLAEKLKSHQTEGLHFLWKRLIDDGLLPAGLKCRGSIRVEDRAAAYARSYGAVLGHSMGLGKTFTSLCFVMLVQAELHRRLQAANKSISESVIPPFGACPRLRVLIVAPRSCIPHWEQSVQDWIRSDLFTSSMPMHIPSFRPRESITIALEKFYRVGGIMVLGYEEHLRLLERLDQQLDRAPNTPLPVRNVEPAHRRITSLLDTLRPPPPTEVARWKAKAATYSDMLRDVDVVLLDESHRLKTIKSVQVRELTKNIANVPLRVALTGTPLQNHLSEYLCMTNIVNGLRVDPVHFRQSIAQPIERGQCVDASRHDFEKMQICVARLRSMFSGMVHRCGVELLERSLPPRFETILFVELSRSQEQCYHEMLKRRGESIKVLEMRHEASRICAHPILVDSRYCAQHDLERDDGDSSGHGEDDEGVRVDHRHALPRLESRKRVRSGFDIPPNALEQAKLDDSPKLRLCIDLIKQILQRGEKVVVFAMYIGILQLTAHFLMQRRIDYFLLTGDTMLERRRAMMQEFRQNKPGTPSVFMCSTKAGGVGINLLPANHCILLDTSWNPADDCQATFRIYRYGQTMPVYTYRLCSYGTAEHVVFSYAVRKEWTHRKVADVGDPHRREREERVHYLQYPCSLPLPGWVLNDNVPGSPAATAKANPLGRVGGLPHARQLAFGLSRSFAHLQSSSSDSGSSSCDGSDNDDDGYRPQAPRPSRQGAPSRSKPPPTASIVTFKQYLERSCPLILTLHQHVLSTVVAAVEHSFLLRDNTDEIIKDLHKQLEEKANTTRLLLARPTHTLHADDDDENSTKVGVRGAQHRGGALIEPHLLHNELPVEDKIAHIADTFVAALWDRYQEASLTKFGSRHNSRAAWESEVVSTWGELLKQLDDHRGAASEQPLLSSHKLQSVRSIVVLGYRLACTEFVKTLKHSTTRATLDAHCRLALHLDLLTALSTKGATVWERLPTAWVCECLTEQSFKRPFVQQMIHMGIRSLLWRALQQPRGAHGAVSDVVTSAVELIVAHRILEDGGDFIHPLLHVGISDSQQLRMLDVFIDTLMHSIWPEYKGIPPSPLASEERLKAARQPLSALIDSDREWGDVDPSAVLSMAQAAVLTNLPLSADRMGHYLCGQCSRGIVRIRAPNEAFDRQGGSRGSAVRVCCDVCDYDLVDVLLHKPALRSDLILERWSVGLLSLADWDIPRSVGAEFALEELTHQHPIKFMHELIRTQRFAKGLFTRKDANCSFFSPRPEQRKLADLTKVQGAVHTLPRVLYAAGIDVALSQVPRHHLMMLSLQCGASSLQELARRLQVYGSGVYEHAKTNCRATLVECWSQLRSQSEYNDQRVPEMFVLLGLHYTAAFEITSTADLLDDAAFRDVSFDHDDDDDSSPSSQPNSDTDAARCQRLVMFREVCYALAWSRYRERLVQSPVPKNLMEVVMRHKKSLRSLGAMASSPMDSPLVRPQASEFLPWSNDPAREALLQDVHHLADEVNSFISDTSVPSPPSAFDSDEDEALPSKIAHTWTRSMLSLEDGASIWTEEDLAAIKKYRGDLLWNALVEVFGPGVLSTPVWLATRSEPTEDETSEADHDDLITSELLIPDDMHFVTFGTIAPMSPAQAADAFFHMMVEAACEISWVG